MRRPTVILLVLFALLAGLVWYARQPDNALNKALATSTSLSAQPYLALLNPAQGLITSIVIQDAAGKKISIHKSSGYWMINTGVDVPANQDSANSIAVQLLSMRIVSNLLTAPDPAGTGLDKPAYLATFTQDGGTISSFKIGKLAATGSGYYVENRDGNVSIVDKDAIEALLNNLKTPPLLATDVPSVSATPEATSTKAP